MNWKHSPHPLWWALLAMALVGCDEKSKLEKEVLREREVVRFVRQVQRGRYDLITAAELKKLIDDAAPMVLVDAGPSEGTFAEQHIPGARYFPFPPDEMESWDEQQMGGRSAADFRALLGEDTSKLVVVYAGFVRSIRAHNGARYARELGYTNVKRFPGGLYAWKGSGYATEAAKE